MLYCINWERENVDCPVLEFSFSSLHFDPCKIMLTCDNKNCGTECSWQLDSKKAVNGYFFHVIIAYDSCSNCKVHGIVITIFFI